MRWGESESVVWRQIHFLLLSILLCGRVEHRQEEEEGSELWYFKARHWHRSPRHRRGSGSSQGRVSRAMGQLLPGLACWYLQMSSLKCWRSLLLLKRSPECLGYCSRVEGTQRGPLWPNTEAPCQCPSVQPQTHTWPSSTQQASPQTGPTAS